MWLEAKPERTAGIFNISPFYRFCFTERVYASWLTNSGVIFQMVKVFP
jgi:hypothetical protein